MRTSAVSLPAWHLQIAYGSTGAGGGGVTGGRDLGGRRPKDDLEEATRPEDGGRAKSKAEVLRALLRERLERRKKRVDAHAIASGLGLIGMTLWRRPRSSS